jgi:hypothetical protein
MRCSPRAAAELICKSEARRHEVRQSEFNGLDYLEVGDDQRTLSVYFLGPVPEGIGIDDFAITGGVRICEIRITDVQVCSPADGELDGSVALTVDKPGDFSSYTLCLVRLPGAARCDPRYRCLQFSFKAACPSELDCKPELSCPAEPSDAFDVDHLAKDYASFRQLLLDRLALVMPQWKERHVPDLGITLVELLAYVGDDLSYFQDAVATEAYLETARRRISVRRHARLVDYRMHEGCNARVFVAVETTSDWILESRELSFLTAFADAPEAVDRVPSWDEFRDVPESRFEVFEPLAEAPGGELRLFAAHNRLRFYTWGDSECCLPRGATSATLFDGAPPSCPQQPERKSAEPSDPPCEGTPTAQTAPVTAPVPASDGRVLHLQTDDVLIFVEAIGPRTGSARDADPAHRHAVRLTGVRPVLDPLNGQPLLEITWAVEDALPFPFCLSVIGPPPECRLIQDVSIALGNVVLADHGRSRPAPQDLGCVPTQSEEVVCLREGRVSEPIRHAGRFRHAELAGPLTFAAPLATSGPLSARLEQDPRQALPWIRLTSAPDPACGPQPSGSGSLEWTAVLDLLASARDDTHFVVEVDERGRSRLRFGDGKLGRSPDAGARFAAHYRTGNGPAGNIGADKLTLAVAAQPISGLALRPRNPLPARGGLAPESVAQVKLFAAHAFKLGLERAVTAADYAEIAAQHPAVSRAAAELRWNGSSYGVRVAIDPLGRAEPDASLLAQVSRHLQRFRRIGHDLTVRPAAYVALDIALEVCVLPAYLKGHVEAALRRRFGSGTLTDGTPAYFHPDVLSFGQSIALSRLVAAAQAIEGVHSVRALVLERLFEGPSGEIEAGVLPIGPLEIARLDGDPNFPENGRIRFEMRGGR